MNNDYSQTDVSIHLEASANRSLRKELKLLDEEIDGLKERRSQLFDMLYDYERRGLTPELCEQALKLRQKMNERKMPLEGRVLFVPPNTEFRGARLRGFDVVVVTKPVAVRLDGDLVE